MKISLEKIANVIGIAAVVLPIITVMLYDYVLGVTEALVLALVAWIYSKIGYDIPRCDVLIWAILAVPFVICAYYAWWVSVFCLILLFVARVLGDADMTNPRTPLGKFIKEMWG